MTGSIFVSAGASQEVEDSQRSFEEPRGWSSHHGNAGNSAAVSINGGFPAPTSVAWEYDYTGDVAVADQVVYLRTGGEIHSLEAENGTVRWESDDVGAAGTPAVVDDAVYVGGDAVTALEAPTGEVRWRTGFESEGQVPDPTVAFETVYVVVDGTLYALDRADGSIRWERESVTLETHDGEEETARFASTPVAADEQSIYAGAGDAGFVALDPVTGVERWTYREPYPATSMNYHEYLIVGAGRLFTGQMSDGGEFPVLDVTTGERVEHTSYYFPPAVTESAKVTTGRHGFRAYHYDTEYSWSVGGATDAWGRPIVVGRTVVLAHHSYAKDEPKLYGFDLEDGAELWSFPLTKLGVEDSTESRWPTTSCAADGNALYVSTSDRIAALRSSDNGDGEGDEGDGDDGDERSIDLSVRAPESVEYREDADPAEDGADFDITVTNRGDEAVSVEVRLEIGSVDEPVFLELAGGETDTAHYTVTTRDLGIGEHDWTVTANDESETGTLVVTEQKEC